MRAALAGANAGNSRNIDAILHRYRYGSSRIEPYQLDIGVRQFGLVMTLAEQEALFSAGISHIIAACSYAQMSGIYAGRIIAGVEEN